MADIPYIMAFLNTVEGTYRRGYIPCNRKSDGKGRNYIGPAGTPADGVLYASTGSPESFTAMQQSGVTIGTGIDLGQKSIDELKSYGVPHAMIGRFLPYIGEKKDDALKALWKSPLLLTPEEASSLDNAAVPGYFDRYARPTFERDAGISFDSLPKQAQAVIMSCLYQKGPGVRKSWPKLWSYFISQDWQAASNELLYGFKKEASHPARRKVEGRLLAELL